MKKKGQNNSLQSQEQTIKEKKLPPIKLSPVSNQKNQHKKNETVQINKDKLKNGVLKQKQKQIQKIQSSNKVQNKKQRKFVLDEYDEKAVVLCQFCGGQRCPQQDYLTNKIQPNAIQGLHSNWITENVLAMQRPSNILIEKHNLINVFKQYNINTILNLQQPGEHPYCGHGIDPLIGFSYDPQVFFANQIRFQNQFWEDMTSTSFEQMMKIMNIFERSINTNKGKISVHCHAGRGRTLMAICAWLIYNDRMTAEQTIDLATQKRQGVLTRSSQRDFLRDFQKQLSNRWRSFNYDQQNNLKSFSGFIQWQSVSHLKNELNKLNMVAFLHGTIMNILRMRMRKEYKQIVWAFVDLNNSQIFNKKWGNEDQHRLTFLKNYLDKKNISKIEQDEQIRILVSLLQDFYDNITFTPISLHAIDQLRNQIQVEKSILNNQSEKRKITKEQLKGKVLKHWDELRQGTSRTNHINTEQQSPIPSTNKNHNESPNKNQKTLQQNEESQNRNQLKLQSSYNFMKTNSAESKCDLPLSQIQINSFHLKILTEPSIVHEFGLNSLCTFLDFVKFTKELIGKYKQVNRQAKQEEIETIQKCILTKFSILLQSKKRFFPLIFSGHNYRESRMMKKIHKISKYTNKNIQYLANFMKNVMNQLPEEQNQYKKLIFKIQKVQSNVDYFAKSHSNSGGRFFSIKDAQKVYDESRIN